MIPLSGQGHVRGICFRLILLANWEPDTADNLRAGSAASQQLCNMLTQLMMLWMKTNTDTSPYSTTGSIIVQFLDSYSRLTSNACILLKTLCAICYATLSVHANPPTQVTSNLP